MDYSTGAVVVVVIYALIILGKGIWLHYRQQSTLLNYFLAGRSLRPLVLVMTIAASFFSMFSFMGAYGTTWRIGINFLNQGWWMLMFISWVGVAIGGRIWILGQRFDFITPADLLAHYYDSAVVRGLVVILAVLTVFPYAAIQFSGVGKMLESFTGGVVPYDVGVVVFLVFTAFYTLISGMRGVAWTDVLQGAFFFAIMFSVMFWVFQHFGGVGATVQKVQATNPKLLEFTKGFPWFLNLSVIWGLGFAVLPHIWQRWYAADSLTTIHRSSWILGVVSWALCLPIMFVGLAGHLLLPELEAGNSDSLFPMLMSRYLPGLGMFVVAAAFGAAMSTIDSMLLSISSIFENDVYAHYIQPDASDAQRTFMGRGFVLVFSALLMAFALSETGRSLIVPIANVGAAIGLVVIPSLIGPLYWPRGTKAGAISSLTTGLLFMLLTLAPQIRDWMLPDAGYLSFPALSGFLLSASVYFGVSLVTRPLPYRKQEKYHGYLSRVLYGAGVEADEPRTDTRVKTSLRSPED